MDHNVLYGQGAQTLKHVPVDRNGNHVVVNSPTYSIVDLREGKSSSERTIVSSTAATIDSFSTTTDTTVGRSYANPNSVSVSDVTGVVANRRYLISDDEGSELFTVESVDSSNNTLYTSKSLQGDYTSGATVAAIEVEGTFPSSEANDEDNTVEDRGGPYQVIWSYSIDSVPHLVPELVWVTRYTYEPWITREELLRGHSQIDQRASRESVSDAMIIASEEVEAEMLAGGLDPRQYRSSQVGRVAVRWLALHYIFMGFHGDQDSDMASEYYDRYKDYMGKLLISGPERAQVVRDDTDQPDSIELSRNKIFSRP